MNGLASQESLLREGLDRLEVGCTEAGITSTLEYLGELDLWNRRYNLVRGTARDLVVRHVLDSVAPLKRIEGEWRRVLSVMEEAKDVSIVDVGSGAGFPGVPLALLGGLPVTLLDRSERAVTFLRAVCAKVRADGLGAGADPRTRLSIRHQDAAECRERYPLAVARALSPGGGEGLAVVAGLLSKNGRGVVYAGTRESAAALAAAGTNETGTNKTGTNNTGTAPFLHSRIEKIAVPFLDAPRHVVIFETPRGG